MGMIDDLNEIIWAKIEERFMQRVLTSADGCWIWQGHNNGNYGTFYVLGAGKTVYAHRLSFEMFKEPILEDNIIMHSCDTPLCVNPNHLFQGTQLENMLDKISKGRQAYPGMKRPLYGVDNPAAKVDDATVQAIRDSYDSQSTSYRELAQRFGISKSQAFRIIKGTSWTTSS